MIPTLPAEVHVMILRWCIAVLPCRTPRLVDGRHIWESELEPHLMKHRKSALVDLCLVSRVHRFHAQRALFSQFTVGIDSSARRTPAAALFWPRLLFFILHPHLSRHVITLVLYGNDGVRTRDALAVLAGTFPNVENMVVNNCQEQYIRAQILHGLAPQLHSLRNIHGQITYSYDLDYDLIGFPLIQQGLDRVALKQLNFSTIIPFAAGRTLAKFLTSETRETLRSLSIKLHSSFEYCAVRDCLRNIGSFSALSVLSLTILTTPLLLEVISLDSDGDVSLGALPNVSDLTICTSGEAHGVLLLRNLLSSASLPALVRLTIRLELQHRDWATKCWQLHPFHKSDSEAVDSPVLGTNTARRLQDFSILLDARGDITVHETSRFLRLFGGAGHPTVIRAGSIASHGNIVLTED